jgi:hypothetical protein
MLKKALHEWGWRQKTTGGIYFTKKWRAETLQPGSEFDNFKPRLKIGTFKCISLLSGLFFWGSWSGFSERKSQDLSNGTNVSFQLTRFFPIFTSIVWDEQNGFDMTQKPAKKVMIDLAYSYIIGLPMELSCTVCIFSVCHLYICFVQIVI